MKNKKVCSKTRPPPASSLFKGQGTEHTTVKCLIVACGEQTYFPSSLPSVLFRRERSDDRKYVCSLRAMPIAICRIWGGGGDVYYVWMLSMLVQLHFFNLKTPFCNTSTFHASYFNRIVKSWNLTVNLRLKAVSLVSMT